jgi:hypothetical protein
MGVGGGDGAKSGGGTPLQGLFGDLLGKGYGMMEGAGAATPPPPTSPGLPFAPPQVALPGYSDFTIGQFGRLTPEELARYNAENGIVTGRGGGSAPTPGSATAAMKSRGGGNFRVRGAA